MKVLAFSDIHSPFGHPNYLKWLLKVVEDEKPDEIVLNGDAFDNYAWSSFSTDPDKQSQRPEYLAALKGLKGYYEAFPELKMVLGNHDRRPWRKAKSAGISDDFMKDFKDIYKCPEGWDIKDRHIIDGVLYDHGELIGGSGGWQNAPLKYGQSVVFGHLHSVAGTRFFMRPSGEVIFSCGLGCGMDIRAYAFEYAKNSPTPPVLSCGIIEGSEKAKVLTMPARFRKTRRQPYE